LSYIIQLSEEAEADLTEACAWYNLQRKNLGFELNLSVEASIFSITRNPKQYQKRHKNVRVAFVRRFPYGIHFILEKEIISVIAIFHTSRNPKKWGDRKH
jgi:plasmid stabilization system protein ParE